MAEASYSQVAKDLGIKCNEIIETLCRKTGGSAARDCVEKDFSFVSMSKI